MGEPERRRPVEKTSVLPGACDQQFGVRPGQIVLRIFSLNPSNSEPSLFSKKKSGPTSARVPDLNFSVFPTNKMEKRCILRPLTGCLPSKLIYRNDPSNSRNEGNYSQDRDYRTQAQNVAHTSEFSA